MTTREARLMRWRTSAYAAWSIIGILVLIAAAGYVIGRISGALAPFVIAFLFVFALQSPVAHLENRGFPRGWAVIWWFVLGFVVLSVLIVFIAPPIGRQAVEFANAVPRFTATAQDWLQATQSKFSSIVLPDWIRQSTLSVARSLSNLFVVFGNGVARALLNAGSGIATIVFDLFLGVVIAFWTLKDLPKIRRELRLLAGDKYEDDLENLLATIGRMVGGYLKGQTIASLVTGTLAFLGLWAIGVPFSLMLGLITFIFNYVPYVGPFAAGLIAAVLGLFEGPLVALGAIAIVVVAQNLTDTLVTPRVMSEQVDLHPTLVIFSLLVGGALFGFWGMIFSIPVAATAKALFVYYYERKTQRSLATENGALFRASQCDEDTGEPCDESDTTAE